MKKNTLLLLFVLINFISYSQIYETEELRIQEEKHILEKNKKLGIQVEKTETPTNITAEKFDFSKIDNPYTLVEIDAVDYSKKHSKQEMLAFNIEIKDELNTSIILISNKFDKWISVSKIDYSFSIKPIIIINNVISFVNCESCIVEPFTIIEKSENILILESLAQDENKFYTVRLTFKK